MATQHFKGNLLLNLYREEKILLFFFFSLLPLKRERNIWHLRPLSSIWRSCLLPSHCPWDFSGKNTEVDCYAFTRGSFWPRSLTHISCVSCIGRNGFFTTEPPGKPRMNSSNACYNKADLRLHITLAKKSSVWDSVREDWGFPGGSDGKESACYAGDMWSISVSLISGSGRSPIEGNSYPLQYNWVTSIHTGHSLGSCLWTHILLLSQQPCLQFLLTNRHGIIYCLACQQFCYQCLWISFKACKPAFGWRTLLLSECHYLSTSHPHCQNCQEL